MSGGVDILSIGCGEAVWRVWRGCLEGVFQVSGWWGRMAGSCR